MNILLGRGKCFIKNCMSKGKDWHKPGKHSHITCSFAVAQKVTMNKVQKCNNFVSVLNVHI